MLRTGPVLAGFILLVAITLVTGNQEPTNESHEGETPDIGPSSKIQRSTDVSANGAVYTIWGRTVCPDGADLVYKGFIGGGYYTHEGASTEYVCLTDTPKWYRNFPAHNDYSYMYGAEYKAGDGLFDLQNVGDDTIVNHDAVCAVCQSPRPAQVMVPGTMYCMSGWTREYYGYLMSSKGKGQLRTNFICVDVSPETIFGGSKYESGSELWPVEPSCTKSLPCPPYEAWKELTCAVCSK